VINMANKKEDILNLFKSFEDDGATSDVKLASDKKSKITDVIPTGSLMLDDALSCFGYPKGRLIQLYGEAGCGKTLLAMLAMKNAQAQDPDAYQVFIDAEQTFSKPWADSLGIDTSRVIIVEGEMAVNGRKCFEVLLGVPKKNAKNEYAGQSKNGLLDEIKLKKLNVNFIVLDSLGSIIPVGEDTAEVGKQSMALFSRFLTPILKKLSLALTKANVPMIIINHIRSTFDMYGPDHTFAGGNSYRHYLSANIYLAHVNRADAKILNEDEQKIGATIKATVEKSKFGPHPRSCEFKINFDKGFIAQEEEILELALKYNVIKKISTVTHEYKNEKFRGRDAVLSFLRDNPDLCDNVLVDIKKIQNKKYDEDTFQQAPESEETLDTDEDAATIDESDDAEGGDEVKKKRGRKKSVSITHP
jgi:recombination protein RecA